MQIRNGQLTADPKKTSATDERAGGILDATTFPGYAAKGVANLRAKHPSELTFEESWWLVGAESVLNKVSEEQHRAESGWDAVEEGAQFDRDNPPVFTEREWNFSHDEDGNDRDNHDLGSGFSEDFVL